MWELLITYKIPQGGLMGLGWENKKTLYSQILRGEPSAIFGPQEVPLGRCPELRAAFEPLRGLPYYSPPCFANVKNRASPIASHHSFLHILPLHYH